DHRNPGARSRKAAGVARRLDPDQRPADPRTLAVGQPGWQPPARQRHRGDARHQAFRPLASAEAVGWKARNPRRPGGRRRGADGFALRRLVSQFGLRFPALTALDLPSGGPAYPLATPFARVKFQATEEFAMVAAIFNGDPAPVGLGDPQLRDAGGTAFRTNDHLLGFTEFQYATGQGKGELPATYK